MFSLFLAGEQSRKMYPVTVFCKEDGYDAFVRTCAPTLPEEVLTASTLPPPAKWLDMGAGDGNAVRLLRSLGYKAEGIDLDPWGEDVTAGDYLNPPYEPGSFDGILSQCNFYVSGNVPEALRQAGKLLRKGGKLVFSDVTEDVVALLNQTRQAGFAVRHLEDLTDQWKEYYLEALWTRDDVCLPRGKKITYVLFVCERM